MLGTLLLSLAVTTGAGAAAGAPTKPAAASPDEAALLALDQLFQTAFNKKDIDQLMTYYADDAVVMDPGPALWLRGKAEIRKSFTDMVNAPGSMKLKLHDETCHVVGTMGYCAGLWTMTITDPAGKSSEMKGRATAVFEKRAGKWLAVADHASVPLPPPPAPDAAPAAAAPVKK